MAYPVWNISGWPVIHDEPRGRNPHAWRARNPTASFEDWWLFKPVKLGQRHGKGGEAAEPYRRQDDYVEKVTYELSQLLGLPAARAELAHEFSSTGELTEGVVSQNIVPEPWASHSGDTALSVFPDYQSCAGDNKPKERIGHNLDNIWQVLDGALGPPGSECADWRAFDVMVGYLVFDAWTANTDRHAENWMLLTQSDQTRLAPTFDHGSALASGWTDAEFAKGDVDRFAAKTRATRFEGGRAYSLAELALRAEQMAVHRAMAAGEPSLAPQWRARLGSLSPVDWEGVTLGVEGLSVPARRFMTELLAENWRRLGDVR